MTFLKAEDLDEIRDRLGEKVSIYLSLDVDFLSID